MLYALAGLSLLVSSALGQQCPSIDGLRSEQWLIRRSQRATNARGAPPFPAHQKVTRVLAGVGMGVCDTMKAQFGPRAPHKEETLCVKFPNQSACKNITLCSPGQGQYFSYPFWSDAIDIAAAAAKNPREFGAEKRTDVKACLTCYALAKPPLPQLVSPRDPKKQSVTVSTRVACGQPLQAESGPYFGPNAAQRQQMSQLDAQLQQCAIRPAPQCAQLAAQRAQFIQSFQLVQGGEPVLGHKATLEEIPYDQARVFQTEVTFSGAEGAILTSVPLPDGLAYPNGISPNTCSAFEYGMVVVSPGRVATSCWLTPMFKSASARNAYLDKEYKAEEQIQTAKRRADAKQCRQNFSKANRALNAFISQRRTNPQTQPSPLLQFIPKCIVFCKTAKATLPANHNFIKRAFPKLCTQNYLPLEAKLAALGGGAQG